MARRSLRLPGFHYRGGAGYFVTLCCRRRQPVLGAVRNGQMERTPLGQLIEDRWAMIPTRDPEIQLDEFILMPDHLHGILEFGESARLSLPRVMAWFKGTGLVEARRRGLWGDQGLWQRGYYDHVIRGIRDRDRIRAYIRSNPIRFESRALHRER